MCNKKGTLSIDCIALTIYQWYYRLRLHLSHHTYQVLHLVFTRQQLYLIKQRYTSVSEEIILMTGRLFFNQLR